MTNIFVLTELQLVENSRSYCYNCGDDGYESINSTVSTIFGEDAVEKLAELLFDCNISMRAGNQYFASIVVNGLPIVSNQTEFEGALDYIDGRVATYPFRVDSHGQPVRVYKGSKEYTLSQYAEFINDDIHAKYMDALNLFRSVLDISLKMTEKNKEEEKQKAIEAQKEKNRERNRLAREKRNEKKKDDEKQLAALIRKLPHLAEVIIRQVNHP